MDFDYTDDQRLLRETADRFIADRYGFEDRRRRLAEAPGWSRPLWSEMAELGLLALPFAEADGGFGGGGVETMVLMEAFGRGLLVEPFFSTAVLAGSALRHGGSEAQRQSRVPRIAAGEHLMALAHSEATGPRHTIDRLSTRLEGDRVTGEKVAVIHGDTADELVVSARGADGVALLLVDAKADGVTIRGERAYDGTRVARVTLEQAPAERLTGGADTLSAIFDEANAALAAEAVGVMALALDQTTDYLKTRKQFGVPLGHFQVLQHRAVDMLMQLELARSMAIFAALSLTLPPDERSRNISQAKVQIARSARFVGQQAVQLHGGIGITEEYGVGHAFKRLTAIETLFGDADWHLDRLAGD